jgi:hypothetical protein
MAKKVCSVRGIDHRGLPKIVLVEAGTLFEAAAAGLEQLYQQEGCLSPVLEVTVHEAAGKHRVRIKQLAAWLGKHDSEQTIGVTALKRRVGELLQNNKAAG